MKQVVLNQPGDFALVECEAPSPAEGEALVRVHRMGVCGTDLHAFAGRQPFFSYPRVLGHELGVEIVEINGEACGLSPGDRCAVEPYLNCGRCIACRRGKPNCCESLKVLGVHVDGGMQPLYTVPTRKLHRSDALSLDQLALVETLGIGRHAVDRASPARDDVALVIGAGPIGLTVMQFAQGEVARLVTMDMVDDRLAFARDMMGVDATINASTPSPDDLEAALRDACGGELPTLIFDATGNVRSMMNTFHLIAPGGGIIFVGLFVGEVSFDDPNFHKREVTLKSSRNATPDCFTRIIAAMEAGVIDTTPWVTHRLQLEDVPQQFETLPGSKGLVKAMVEIE